MATKRLLPNYDVFDERRYFHPGVGPQSIINVDGVAVGMLVCEDVWTTMGPAAELALQGATLLVVANASPYARGRREEREASARRARSRDELPDRLRQPGRRTGRVGLRRPELRGERRRRRRRARQRRSARSC